MTKRVFMLVCALFCVLASNAQPTDVRRFEWEIGLGLADGLSVLNLDKCTPGPKLYTELRYNIKAIPIDLGVQATTGYFWRSAEQVQNADRLKTTSVNIMAVADYNLRRGKNFSIFAGVGLGLGILDITAPISFDNTQMNWSGYLTGDRSARLAFMPRIGVELWNHLRVSLTLTTQEKANNQYAVNVGLVFGGGRK